MLQEEVFGHIIPLYAVVAKVDISFVRHYSFITLGGDIGTAFVKHRKRNK